MSEEMKPCPICNSPVRLRKSHVAGEGAWIEHEGNSHCPVQFGSLYPDDTLADQWNTRAESPELTSLREQVRKLTEENKQLEPEKALLYRIREQVAAGLGVQTSHLSDVQLLGALSELSSAKQQIEELTKWKTEHERILSVSNQHFREAVDSTGMWPTNDRPGIKGVCDKLNTLAARCAELEKERAKCCLCGESILYAVERAQLIEGFFMHAKCWKEKIESPRDRITQLESEAARLREARCSTCAYWQKCPTVVPGCESEMICGYSKQAAGGLNGQDGRAIITPPDFGCIHWRAAVSERDGK